MTKSSSRQQANIRSRYMRVLRDIWLRLYRISVAWGLERPYFQASCVLAWRLLGSYPVQKAFFPIQVDLIQQFMHATGLQATHSVPQTVQQRLLESTLMKWRYENAADCLSAKDIKRYFVFKNWHLFEQAQRSGRGVLFVLSHYGLPKVFIALMRQRGYHGKVIRLRIKQRLQAEGREVTQINRMLMSASDLMIAQEALTDGGIAYILSDGNHGAVAGVRALFGQMRPFRGGFAELAMTTGAVIMPVTAVPRKDGQVCITFFEPLDSGSAAINHQARVEHLITQYAEHLTQIYAHSPGSVRLNFMHRFLYDEPNEPWAHTGVGETLGG